MTSTCIYQVSGDSQFFFSSWVFEKRILNNSFANFNYKLESIRILIKKILPKIKRLLIYFRQFLLFCESEYLSITSLTAITNWNRIVFGSKKTQSLLTYSQLDRLRQCTRQACLMNVTNPKLSYHTIFASLRSTILRAVYWRNDGRRIVYAASSRLYESMDKSTFELDTDTHRFSPKSEVDLQKTFFRNGHFVSYVSPSSWVKKYKNDKYEHFG